MTLRRSTSITRSARNRRYYEKHRKATGENLKPFIGVDGEGGGTDDVGRQNFLLLRAGEMELFCANNPLSTRECLDFLLSTPKNAILCGYYFTYDATQILRDLPPERIANLFEPKPRIPGFSPYTFWEDYAIEFRPRQYFRV
ncbi:MAG TPA: hypothetical protein VNT76_18915, partial [Candidatus Binatus sp.]|nr:hypothetical protein [Candidatus Binatus sp.]